MDTISFGNFSKNQSVEEMMQSAVLFHKNGNLALAEDKYKAVLFSSPMHTDANHNMGILSLHAGKYNECIYYTKRAISSNPLNAEYWSTYIWALILSGYIADARNQLNECISKGMNCDTLNKAAERLSAPASEEIDNIINFFTKSDFESTEIYSKKMVIDYPHFGFGYKILSALATIKNNFNDALEYGKKSIELLPGDSESFSNYGLALYKTGDMKKAQEVLHEAVKLNNKNVNAVLNLSMVLINLEEYTEAEILNMSALDIDANNYIAYANLGNINFFRKDYDNAIEFYLKSIQINPTKWGPYNNLGAIYHKRNNIELSLDYYNKANECCPSNEKSAVLYGIAHDYFILERMEDAIDYFNRALAMPSDIWVLDALAFLSIIYYIKNDYQKVRELYEQSCMINIDRDVKGHTLSRYFDYLIALIDARKEISTNESDKKLHVIGESHSLGLNNLNVLLSGEEYICKSEWILGIKAYHLSNDAESRQKRQFESIVSNIPNGSNLLLTIGEIDCRVDEGILNVWNKDRNISLEEIVEKTVSGYIRYVKKITAKYNHTSIISGVPAPKISAEHKWTEQAEELTSVIRLFNEYLKKYSLAEGMGFLDVYELTNRGDGMSDGVYHIDNVHLKPNTLIEAFNTKLSF